MKMSEYNDTAEAKFRSLLPLEKQLLRKLADVQDALDRGTSKDGNGKRKKFKTGHVDLAQLISELNTNQQQLEKAIEGLQVKNLILMPSLGRFEFTLPFTTLRVADEK